MTVRGIYNADGITTYTVADAHLITSKSLGGKIVYGENDLKVTAQTTPSMSIKVASGVCSSNGALLQNTASYTVAIASNTASYPRIDAIVAYISGTNRQIKVLQGTASISPSAQSTSSSDYVKLAEVYVGVGITAIQTSNIKDCRSENTIFNSLSEKVFDIDKVLNGLTYKQSNIEIDKTPARGFYVDENKFTYQWLAQNIISSSLGLIDIKLTLPKTFTVRTSVACSVWLIPSDYASSNSNLAATGYLKAFMTGDNEVRVIANNLTSGVTYLLRVQCQGF